MASLYDLLKTPEQTVVLKGKTGYCALKDKQDSTSKFSTDKVWSVALVDPELAPLDDLAKYGFKYDPNTELAKHILDEGVSHGTFTYGTSSPNAGHKGWSYEWGANPNQLPARVIDMKTRDAKPAPEALKNELRSGQDVYLFLRTYEYNFNGKKGISLSLEGVGLPDLSKAQYINGGGSTDSFMSMFGDGSAPAAQSAPTTDPKSADKPAADPSAKDAGSDDATDDESIDDLFS